MKARFLPVALIGTLLIAFAAIAAACGGDGNGDGGELSLEEYFQRLETLGQSYEDAGDALEVEMDEKFESLTSEDEQVEAFLDFLNEALPLVRDFVEALDDLNPPAEAADLHSGAVDAGQELVDMFESAMVVAEGVESIVDAAALLEAPGFAEASDGFTDACVALQGLAMENGIEIDLLCG